MKKTLVSIFILLFLIIGCSSNKSNDSDGDVVTDTDTLTDDEIGDQDSDSVGDGDENSDADTNVIDEDTVIIDEDNSSTDEDAPTPPNSFVSVWKTDNLDIHNPYQSHDNQVKLPLVEMGIYNFKVYWGDGTEDTITEWDALATKHTYPEPGTYTITISGEMVGWSFYTYDAALEREIRGDADKLLEISSWGCFDFGNTNGQFFGCKNLEITADDTPALTHTSTARKMFEGCEVLTEVPLINTWNFSNITSMEAMFAGALQFNQDISAWDVSKVDSMERMFDMALVFNQDISSWDVSKTTTFKQMFLHAKKFDQDISSWTVSSAITLEEMFMWATSFNQDISAWDLSRATSMRGMFWGATAFNHDVSKWTLSRVLNMEGLFYWATAFNQDIAIWDTSKVTTMNQMFMGATAFKQDISAWDVSSVTTMQDMFKDNALSTLHYDALLTGWAAQSLQSDVVFDAGTSLYSAGDAATARQKIIDDFGWTITDDGEVVE